jgi:hypothetical protein
LGDVTERDHLGRPRPRREDNIRMVLQEVLWEDMDGVELDQVRDRWYAIVNAVMNSGKGKVVP